MADQVLENYLSLVNAFTDFLTVATHTILYERDIYPKESFMGARKYNYAVKQNRHPAVCKFVDDAITAIRTELLKVSPEWQSKLIDPKYRERFGQTVMCDEAEVPIEIAI